MRLDLLARLGLEPHDPDGDARRRRVPDTGPSAMRYLAVTTLSVGAVIAAAAITPGIGHDVRTGLCGTGDTACSKYAIPEASFGDCQVLSHADTVTDDAVVFTDDLGRSGRLTLSRTVDRNAVVHWFVRQDDDSADPSGVTGVDAVAGVGGLGGLGGSSSVGRGEGGRLTEFASEDAAREYITQEQHQPVRERLERADPTGLLARLADRVDGHQPLTQHPNAYFADGGDGLDLAGEARSGVGGDPVAGGESGIAEVKTSTGPEAGSTVYVELSAAAGQALGLLAPPSGQLPAPSGLAVASVAYDWTGRPQRLTIEAAGSLPGVLGPPFGQTTSNIMAGLISPGPSSRGPSGPVPSSPVPSSPVPSSPGQSRPVPSSPVPSSPGQSSPGQSSPVPSSPVPSSPVSNSGSGAGDGRFIGRVSISVPLDGDPATADTAADALHAIGVPLLLGLGRMGGSDGLLDHGGGGTRAATRSGSATTSPVLTFYRMLDRGSPDSSGSSSDSSSGNSSDSSVTVNTYIDPSVGTSQARGNVSLGLQGGLTIAGLLPAADFYYAPRQGFVEWQRCG